MHIDVCSRGHSRDFGAVEAKRWRNSGYQGQPSQARGLLASSGWSSVRACGSWWCRNPGKPTAPGTCDARNVGGRGRNPIRAVSNSFTSSSADREPWRNLSQSPARGSLERGLACRCGCLLICRSHTVPRCSYITARLALDTTGRTTTKMLSILMVLLAVTSVGILATLLVREWPEEKTRAGDPESTN
jgi:hypothetical protein